MLLHLWLVPGTWQYAQHTLSPPPWYLQDGNEVRWAPASNAAVMLEVGHPARVWSETLFPLPGSILGVQS